MDHPLDQLVMDLLAQVPTLVLLVDHRVVQVAQEVHLVEDLPIQEERDLPAVSRTPSCSNCEPRSWPTAC